MIKVVLVDDDTVILSVLQNHIEWERYNMVVDAAFSDSQKALEYLKDNKVQLVFTDLVMPQLTGIELIEICHRHSPQTVYVALSSYDDFHFVKSAFLKGASDYVLKEDLDSSSFQDVLRKMQQRCEASQNEISSNEKNLLDAISNIENRKADDRFSITLFSCPLQELESHLEHSLLNRRNNFRILSMDHLTCVIHRSRFSNNQIPWFESLKGSQEYHDFFIAYQQADEKQEIGGLYYKALEDFQNQQFFERKGFPEPFALYEDCDQLLRIYVTDVKAQCKALQMKEAISSLEQVVTKLANQNLAKNQFLEKVTYAIQIMHESLSYLSGLVPCLADYSSQEIMEASSLSEVKDRIRVMTDELFLQLNQLKSDRFISLIKIYVDQNFNDCNLTIKEIANFFHVNEGNLSRKFYSENKVHLKEYINFVRIENAKLLLSSTLLSVQGISECVGYNNVEHFSRTFKKVVGMSPNQYRGL